MENTLIKRTWFYLQKPSVFEISGCSCGNQETQWSEYQKHLWCDKCEKDFIPEHGGVFDGPIPMGAARMLGLTFSIFNMETNKVEILDSNHQHMECQSTKDVINTKEILVNVRHIGHDDECKKAIYNYETNTLNHNLVDGLKQMEFAIEYPHSNIFILSFQVKDGVIILDENQELKDFRQFILKSTLEENLEERQGPKNKSKI